MDKRDASPSPDDSRSSSRHLSLDRRKIDYGNKWSTVKDLENQLLHLTSNPKSPSPTSKKAITKIASRSALFFEPPDVLAVRRTIAEDPAWSLETVPMLSDICIQNMVNNFTDNPVFDGLNIKQKEQLLEHLPTNLPMKVVAHLIEDENYWKRCCNARWQISDVADYDNSWKRMYFERNLQDIIENYIPAMSDTIRLEEALQFSRNFIHKLDIRQLLPPVKITEPNMNVYERKTIGNRKLKEYDNLLEDECITDHFDFNLVIPKLPYFEELHLTYGVKNCGMNFEWNMFQFTTHDCISLANCIKACETLKVFRLHNSRVDDEKTRILVSHLLNHPSLIDLNFSHNLIGDNGAKAIGKLVSKTCTITTLNLYNNSIGPQGALSLGYSLSVNKTIQTLNLRLNCIEDEGVKALGQALLQNTTLTDLNIASNCLTVNSAVTLAKVIGLNNTLQVLDLSCNSFNIESGKILSDALENNMNLISIDLRMTNCGQEVEYIIMQLLKRNVQRNVQIRLEPKKKSTTSNIKSPISE